MYVIWQTVRILGMVILVICLLLPLSMALASWSVLMQGWKAGLLAKERQLKLTVTAENEQDKAEDEI